MMSTEVPPDDVQRAQPPAPRAPVIPSLYRGLFWLQARALIEKECSELVMWFVCLGVPYAGVLAWIIWAGYYRGNGALVNKDVDLQVVAVIGCPAIALLLGAYQFINDSSPELYPFAVHKPISRLRFFFVKACVGLVAYAATAGLPSLIALTWVNAVGMNSHGDIDRVNMAVAGAVIMGALFYFAGTLLVTRKLKWYGSLWLPVFWPTLATTYIISHLQQYAPWQTLGAYALAALPLVLAASASFDTLGQIHSQPWYARLSLGVLVGAGIAMLMTIVWSFALLGTMQFKTQEEWIETLVLKDGTVVEGYFRNDLSGVRYAAQSSARRGLDAVPANLADIEHLAMMRNLGSFNFTVVFDSTWNHPARHLPGAGNLVIDGASYYADAEWYSITLKDPQTGAVRGAIGAHGVEWGVRTPKREFTKPISPYRPFGIITPDAIYSVTREGQLAPVFRPPDGMPIRQRSTTWNDVRSNPQVTDQFVATTQHLYRVRTTFDRTTQHVDVQVLGTLPVEYSDTAIVVMQDNGRIVALRYDWPLDQPKPSQLVRFLPDGTTDRQAVPMPESQRVTGPLLTVLQTTLDASVPLGYTAWESFGCRYRLYRHGIIYSGLPNDVTTIPRLKWGTVAGFIGAIAMWMVMTHQCFTTRRKLLWCILAFVGGPGMLLLRAVIVPARVLESCPDCHKRRPVELMICPYCAKPWPKPQRDSRDILMHS